MSASRKCSVLVRGTPEDAWLDTLRTQDGIGQILGTFEHPRVRRLKGAKDAAALAATAAASCPGHDLLVIEAGTRLPPRLLLRLQRVLQDADDIGAVAPLSAADSLRSPLPPGRTPSGMDAEVLDRLVFDLSERRWFDLAFGDAECLLLGAEAAATLRGGGSGIAAGLRASGWRTVVCDHACVCSRHGGPVAPGDERDPDLRAPAHPLSRLRYAMARALRHEAPSTVCAGLDPRPVQLHIAHGWGGGVQRWLRDYGAGDGQRINLTLRASGQWRRKSYGETLELSTADGRGPLLGRWVLPSPIHATAVSDPAYRRILQHVMEEFCVDAVLVSSLIGHSLDALRTGLPTRVICHDYYPTCPALNAYFDEVCPVCDEARLARCLEQNPFNRIFRTDAATEWLTLRGAMLDAIDEYPVRLIAPTRSVQENLCNLDARFADRPVTIIPHGSAKLPRLERPAPDKRLRVVVPGRLTAQKGRELLHAMLPGLQAFADITLLGCGREGREFVGLPSVSVVEEYRHDELAEHVGALAPHCGLLLSIVPESFSLTLSELMELGVPPVAVDRGALAERIEHGVTGLLCAPDADAMVTLLRDLAADPDRLGTVRDNLADATPPTLDDMVSAYHQALPLEPADAARYAVHAPSEADYRYSETFDQLYLAQTLVREQRRTIAEHETELETRAEWARRLDAELNKRTRWAESLRRELEYTRTTLDAEIERLHGYYGEQVQRLEEAQEHIDRLLSSTSWRITAPLRWVGHGLRRLRYGTARSATLARRGARSIRTRGVRASAARARELFRRRHVAPPMPGMPDLDRPLDPLSLPVSDEPVVSVIVPAFNHCRHTYACLTSIANTPSSTPFEVIVVDDASTDETPQMLRRIHGLRTQRCEENCGFIRACNSGAAMAHGDYLLFLNNDTVVTPGWLDSMLATFSIHENVGLVGARLIYPNGQLQEAGGIVFSDGSGWNYGRFDDPDDPRYSYTRSVDYCSGACLMIPAELFGEFGGFDDQYAPAYYEDTDLAFRVRDAGLRVMYQPAARIIHFEGVTSGTDPDADTGTKRFQLINQKKFTERWPHALTQQHPPGTNPDIACERDVHRQILIIDATVPRPDHDSGSVRLTNLFRLLRQMGYRVTFFADNLMHEDEYTEALQKIGVRVLNYPWVSSPVEYLRRHGSDYDVVFISRFYIARSYIQLVREYCKRALFVFDTVDLHYLREERLARLKQDTSLLNTATKTRRDELDVISEADVTLVVSDAEKRVLANDAPGATVEIVSNVHAAPGRQAGFDERRDIIFIGGFQHPPNTDAMIWFISDIFPRVRDAEPDLRLHVIGSRVPESIQRLGEQPGVLVTGFVPDITGYLNGSRMSVAPLRYGAGVKGKINTSMSFGLPVVATTTACEGMFLTDGEDVLIADDPDAFADAVTRLYRDEALWTRLSDGGIDNVRRHFSFEAARRALERALSREATGARRTVAGRA